MRNSRGKENFLVRLCITGAAIVVTTGQKLAQKLYEDMRKSGARKFVGTSMHHRCAHCGNHWSKVGTETICRHVRERGQGKFAGMSMHHRAPIVVMTGQKLA